MNHIEQAMREASELIYKGYRKAAQGGIVALFYGGKKSVHINMNNFAYVHSGNLPEVYCSTLRASVL